MVLQTENKQRIAEAAIQAGDALNGRGSRQPNPFSSPI